MTDAYRQIPPPERSLVDEARELIVAVSSSGIGEAKAKGTAIILCGLLVAKAINELTDAVNRLENI